MSFNLYLHSVIAFGHNQWARVCAVTYDFSPICSICLRTSGLSSHAFALRQRTLCANRWGVRIYGRVVEYLQFERVLELCSAPVNNSNLRYSWGALSNNLACYSDLPVTMRVPWRNTEMASRYGWPSVGLNSGLLSGRPARIAWTSSENLWPDQARILTCINRSTLSPVPAVFLGGNRMSLWRRSFSYIWKRLYVSRCEGDLASHLFLPTAQFEVRNPTTAST